jgi:hypothetical protein
MVLPPQAPVDVGAEHAHGTVGEVDDTRSAVDDHQTHGRERIQGAGAYSEDSEFDYLLQRILSCPPLKPRSGIGFEGEARNIY